jgi:hypothetical protein
MGATSDTPAAAADEAMDVEPSTSQSYSQQHFQGGVISNLIVDVCPPIDIESGVEKSLMSTSFLIGLG